MEQQMMLLLLLGCIFEDGRDQTASVFSKSEGGRNGRKYIE